MDKPKLLQEIQRKIFHLAGFIYVVGLVMLPREHFIGVVLAFLLADGILEFLRSKNPAWDDFFIHKLKLVIRPQERGRLSGVFWMILGVLFVAVFVEPPAVGVTVLMYLLLGDGVASLAGIRLGGPKWPGSSKRISGSAACFLVSFWVGAYLLSGYGWAGIVLGALGATILELGFFKINDNLLIPAGSSVILMAVYQLNPFFLFIPK